MPNEIPTQYDPVAIEGETYEAWSSNKAFAAVPDDRTDRYVVMMPLPNVTGALHMGHAMDNVMQDMLIRWHRMKGHNTLWQPGTDHAGIGTQAVVEKRLFELEGKTRHDIGREGLVKRIWEWKDQYQERIIKQQQAMGNSCDWDRQRFTMDAVCASAVREAFFRLFEDRLIYRGLRLVNWDCHLQTAVSDDEVVRESKKGGFWHLRYPVIDPKEGEPEFVVVATTRPETMLGDTAVATHPDPERALRRLVEKLRERLEKAPSKEKPHLLAEIERVEERQQNLLPKLLALVKMAKEGRKVRLPLMEREIPIILDEWAKPELGSGCVKITPAHDPNDYDVWTRHKDEIGTINILNKDGTIHESGGAYAGIDRVLARKKIVADLEAKGLIDAIEERENEIGISDRSKTVIEPYLSKQWFVRMGDVEGGVVFGRGTAKEHHGPGLAQAAINAVRGEWRSPTGRKLTFYPDAERYGSTYVNWLAEKRDWCIGRQLWWGHRVPIWWCEVATDDLASLLAKLPAFDAEQACVYVADEDGAQLPPDEALAAAKSGAKAGPFEVHVCLRDETSQERYASGLEAIGLVWAEDVLDTWFSSALWPFSTLGWPDPEKAPVGDGEQPLRSIDGGPNALDYYYPGSCLVTGRDIITLWVARMAILGLYTLGDLPFTDCFIHASILDGKGVRMSKSKGNGIDPVDIIKRYGADAMRYVICDMQTGMQDIRLPVQAISPYTGNPVELSKAKHGRTIFTYLCPESGKEFDVLGTMADLPQAELISDRFEVGRNFCNKLWNAARFALLHVEDGYVFTARSRAELFEEDRWILSRLSRCSDDVAAKLAAYDPAGAIGAARDFFWNEFCDWYLELIKPRMDDPSTKPVAVQVLAFVLDQSLRLFHPFIPFITEALWTRLNEFAPERGVDAPLDHPALIATATWPVGRRGDLCEDTERDIELMQGAIRAVRDLRARYGIPPKQPLEARIKASGASLVTLQRLQGYVVHQARLSSLQISEDAERPKGAATNVARDIEVYVLGLVDPEKEQQRLAKQRAKLVGGISGTEKKLGNEKFLANAAPEVVESEQKRLGEMKAELLAIDKTLAEL